MIHKTHVDILSVSPKTITVKEELLAVKFSRLNALPSNSVNPIDSFLYVKDPPWIMA